MVSESKTGIVLPYEKAAIRGDEMPDGLSFPDQLMYIALRSLYSQVRQGIIPRDAGVREKRKIMPQYERYRSGWDCGLEWAKKLKVTEAARAAYRKNRSLTAADELVAIMEGVPI